MSLELLCFIKVSFCFQNKDAKQDWDRFKPDIIGVEDIDAVSGNAFRHGVQRRMISVAIFRIFEIITFCFVVAICDLVHGVETIFHLSCVLTASGNLF